MAYEIPGFSFTLPAAVDLRGSLFRAVRTNGTPAVALPNAVGDPIVGVVYNKPDVGQATTIVNSGIVMGEAGAQITLDASGMTPVKVGTDGRFLPHGGAGVVVGFALEPASAAGIITTILLAPGASTEITV